jgi:hypothetical protein
MATSPTSQADEIQREMRQVRAELREDVRDFVASARVMTDWQEYVRAYPWVCLGAAAAVGYFLVPTRVHVIQPDKQTLRELAKEGQLVVKVDPAQKRTGIVDLLVGLAARSLVQGGLAVVSQQLSQGWNGSAPHDREARHDHD